MTLILDGRIVRDKIAADLKKEISRRSSSSSGTKGSKPKLVIIQVGDLAESNAYIRQKVLFGEKIGAIVDHQKFDDNVSLKELTTQISSLNTNLAVNGIIVQVPIPKHLDKDKIIDAIAASKDVDGLTAANLKLLFEGNPQGIMPATTEGILTILDYYKIPIAGKKVVIVGRSSLVGKPTTLAFLNLDATVTICHSWTKNLAEETKRADILIVAVGKPNLITKDHVSRGQVVIDVGINVRSDTRPSFVRQSRTSEGKPETEISDRKLVGDVKFDEVSKIVSAISPVPGGVGPMTVASLFENLFEAYRNQT